MLVLVGERIFILTSFWFSPAPSEISSSRISLDFGLRAADLFFRELIVPELGRIWFVRQLSWPLAGLALHESIRAQGSSGPKATAICHGIESLACKLEFNANQEEPSDRILGSRAFGRDKEGLVWSFQRLCQSSNYVRNTHRQAATRAVRQDGGLGFATGTRFDLLELEPVGKALAQAFLEQPVGKGRMRLRNWLLEWLRGDREVSGSTETLLKALSPVHPTSGERDLVRSRVLETLSDNCEIRRRLASAVGRAAKLPDIEQDIVPRLRDAGHLKQADEVIAARAFGAVLDRTRDAIAELTKAVEPERGGASIAKLARDVAVRKSLSALKSAANNFSLKMGAAGINEPTSQSFADAIIGVDDELHFIRILVGRVGEVLNLADGFVIRGANFRKIEPIEREDERENPNDAQEPDLRASKPVMSGPLATSRTFRIANLHSLLRDAAKVAVA